ncbi:MAG TPA: hypothetical protein VL332_07925 [Candidatus Saccharimonadaceae bacterium]|jgi:hypothetical protein|nr:hypothetical protein [Candidatus Saccharimonadaceae bacterium]
MTRGLRAAPKRVRRAPRASTHRTPPPTAGFLVTSLILGLALAAAALLHREALHAPFFADDFLFLDQVRHRTLLSALTTPDPIGNFMRPLSRALHFWVWSHLSRESAYAFHAANLGFFLTSLALFFVIARRLARGRVAIVATALLALSHATDVPLAWASGAQDLLALMLALLAIALQQRDRPVIAAIAFALALFCKETIALTPFVAVLVSGGETPFGRRLARTGLMFAVLAAWAVLFMVTAHSRPAAAGVVQFQFAAIPAALFHLAQTALGLEWTKGVPLQVRALPAWLPLALVFAALLVGWSVFAGPRSRVTPGRDPVGAILVGLAWAFLGTLPVMMVASIWSAYYYLFALCGVALAIGGVAARWPRAAVLALVGVLAWTSENARRAPSFAVPANPWTTRSHVTPWYIQRSSVMVNRFLADLRRERPTLPPNSTLYFRGVPSFAGWQAGNGALQRWAYRDPTLRTYYLSAFHADQARRGPAFFFSCEGDTLTELFKHASPYPQIGLSMAVEDRPEQASEAFEIGHERRENPTEIEYLSAWTLWAIGRHDQAAERLSALGMTPDSALGNATNIALRAMAVAHDTSFARDVLRLAVNKHALEPTVHERLADLLLLERGRHTDGYFEAYAARVLAPANPLNWRRWGIVQIELKRYRQALATLDTYVAMAGARAADDAMIETARRELRRSLTEDAGPTPPPETAAAARR